LWCWWRWLAADLPSNVQTQKGQSRVVARFSVVVEALGSAVVECLLYLVFNLAMKVMRDE
jgi:hypothetical protein